MTGNEREVIVMPEQRVQPGVFAADARGDQHLVHLFQGGEYGLSDIVELWRLGRLLEPEREGESVVELSRRELDKLKVMADAYSFDYEEGFIEMCLEMHRFASGSSGEPVRFTANF